MLHPYFAVWCRSKTSETIFEARQNEQHGLLFMTAAGRVEMMMGADLTSHPEDVMHPMLLLMERMEGMPGPDRRKGGNVLTPRDNTNVQGRRERA
jgi:hypothetical protein